MSNAELIRRAFEALNRGDPYVFLDAYDPEIEMFVPAWSQLEPGIFRGAKDVERWYALSFAPWRDGHYELEEVHEWGPHVAVWGHWRGVGKRSGTPMESRWLGVFSFADGKIVSIANLGGIGVLPGMG